MALLASDIGLRTSARETRAKTMHISIKLGAAFVALAACATACTAVGAQPAGGDKVYLVGVAGGG